MSYQQQDQPNMYASQPPTQGAPVGYMQNPTYPPNTQNPPAYSGKCRVLVCSDNMLTQADRLLVTGSIFSLFTAFYLFADLVFRYM